MVRATDVVAKGKLTLLGRTIVRFMETHMSNRTVCRKKVYEETECFKEDGTPRTGAQDEAHRLTSDFELSLGAHGGAVCSASLNRGENPRSGGAQFVEKKYDWAGFWSYKQVIVLSRPWSSKRMQYLKVCAQI